VNWTPMPILAAAILSGALFGAVAAPARALDGDELPGRFARRRTVFGLEYATLDNETAVANKALAYAEMGLAGFKHYVEAVDWGSMQEGPDAAIDFSKLDWFVREYQRNGFTELLISLKSHSTWASKDIQNLFGQRVGSNPTPKSEYVSLYAEWVRSVVERYDADGVDDLPGLRWPVRYVEIGNEFSSYEPEPANDYLEMLAVAYDAAHAAYRRVRVAHAAFLTTPVDLAVESPAEYDAVWGATERNDTHHDLADLRTVLDDPDHFDVLNLHNLGDPYELESQIQWLRYEIRRRGYAKPVIVSDTFPTSYVGWGAATECRGAGLGLLIPPATEADRCRLAAFFRKLVKGRAKTLAWTRGFVAADHVQRAVIAAEQGVEMINLSFTFDLPLLTTPALKAGAGIAAWGGAVEVNHFTGRVSSRYPLFYALRQLMGHLEGYKKVKRLRYGDPAVRVYRVKRRGGYLWIGWRDPQGVLLPRDGEPATQIELSTAAPSVTVEAVITEGGRIAPERSTVEASDGVVSLRLTHTPIYVFEDQDSD
jgi:hypothetical protein